MTYTVEKMPQNKTTLLDVLNCIITTPRLWVPCIILIFCAFIFVAEVVLGIIAINESHIEYCRTMVEASSTFNVTPPAGC